MILLFTSDHCAWCGVLKSMLENESEALGTEQNIYEVDVERQYRPVVAKDPGEPYASGKRVGHLL